MKQKERTVIVYEKGTGKTLEHVDVNLPALRSISGFLKGEWNLDVYADCFGGKNRLGDLDGSTEIEGHHLVVEFKEHKNSMTNGQLVKAIRMAEHCNTTTFFVFGKTNQPVEKMIISPNNLNGVFTKTSEEELKQLFSKWHSKAKLNPMKSREEMRKDWKIADRIMREAKKSLWK